MQTVTYDNFVTAVKQEQQEIGAKVEFNIGKKEIVGKGYRFDIYGVEEKWYLKDVVGDEEKIDAKEKNKVFLILLITFPTWINMLVRTYAWMGILQDNGILNNILSLFGLQTKLLHTDFAVILGMVYNFIPFMILQIHTSLTKMDKSLLEAASDLGADKLQCFLKVTFPLSLPGVISGITLVFLPAMSSFFIPKLLGGGQYVLIGNVIESQFLTAGNWNFGSAISLIMAIIIMISMYITKKVEIRNSTGKGRILH